MDSYLPASCFEPGFRIQELPSLEIWTKFKSSFLHLKSLKIPTQCWLGWSSERSVCVSVLRFKNKVKPKRTCTVIETLVTLGCFSDLWWLCGDYFARFTWVDTRVQICGRSNQHPSTLVQTPKLLAVTGCKKEQERFLKSDGAKFFSASLLNNVGVAWLRFYLALTDKDLIENLSKSKKPKLDLVFEEWDVAGLPWWFLGNLRSNYKSRSNGSTDIQTNQVCSHFK